MKTKTEMCCDCCGRKIPIGTFIEPHPTVLNAGIVILGGHQRHWVTLNTEVNHDTN